MQEAAGYNNKHINKLGNMSLATKFNIYIYIKQEY